MVLVGATLFWQQASVVMHSGNLLHAAVHPTFPLTFPVVNSTISRFIDCTSQSHTSLHLFMLPSQVRFVESVISSLHVPVKLNLLYHKPGQETFRRAFTDSKPGRPILRLSTSSQVLQEFVHQQDHFGGWLFVWTARNLSTALLAKKKSCLPSSVTAKYPLSIPWANGLCPVFFQFIAEATLLHRDLTNVNPSWLLNPWVSGFLTSMVQL